MARYLDGTALARLGCLALYALLGFASGAHAGEWSPNPDVRYTLDLSRVNPIGLQSGDSGWAERRVEQMRRSGVAVDHFIVLGRSAAPVLVNGTIAPCRAFQRPGDNPAQFLVSCKSDDFLVDRSEGSISSLGTATAAALVSPKGQAAIIIFSTADARGGVPVGGWWRNPRFGKDSVDWH